MKYLPIIFIIALSGGCARPLTTNEISNLRNEYNDNLKYEEIEVVKKNVKEVDEYKLEIKKIIDSNHIVATKIIEARPFVINNLIYYPKQYYSSDFSKYIGEDDPEWSRFVHENCHILQYRLKLKSNKHQGKEYSWRLGLKEQLLFKDPYKIPPPNEIGNNDRLEDFGFEQQCQFFYCWSLFRHSDYVKSYGKLINSAIEKK